MHYDYRWRNLHFFGEAATSLKAGNAWVTGLIAALHAQWEMSLVYRNYAKNFQTLYGQGFGESSDTSNENGLYWGVRFTPSSQWQFSAYYDRFFFPWLRYRVDAPSDGEEYSFRASFTPNQQTACFVQYRYERKALNHASEKQKTYQPIPIIKQQLTLNLYHQVNAQLSIQSRLQGSHTQHDRASSGHALVQDLRYRTDRFTLNFRLAAFDTNWNNRQYIYEHDVLYSFSIPAYHGKGTRLALVGKWKLNRSIRLWAKYASTHYVDRNEISSGNDLIEGSRKSDVRFQLQVLF